MLCGQRRRRGSSTSNLGQSKAVLPAWGSAGKPLAVWDHLSKAPHGHPCSTLQDTHLDYVVAAAHLFAQAHRVPPCRDRLAIQAILRDVVLPPFSPQEGLQIPLTEEPTEKAPVPTGEVPRYVPGSGLVVVGLWLLVPAPAPTMTQTKVRGTPAVPQCRSITPGVPVSPDHRQLTELTQDLVQLRQELVGDEEAQAPLMDPIDFEKVAEPGRWPCSA